MIKSLKGSAVLVRFSTMAAEEFVSAGAKAEHGSCHVDVVVHIIFPFLSDTAGALMMLTLEKT